MSTTIEGLMREWQERRAPVMTARTCATNTAPVQVICETIGSLEPKMVNTSVVENFRNTLLSRGLSKITVARYLSTLRAGCNGYLDHIDLGKLISELKREPTVVECWTKDEASLLVDGAYAKVGTLFSFFVDFLFSTGCRRGEALALQREDIDIQRNRIHIHRALTLDGELQNGTKWGGERWFPMGKKHRALLDRIFLRGPDSFVFPGLDQRTVGRIFNGVRTSVDVRSFKLHCTRHSAISWALSSGMSLRKASEIFGVSQATLESHYAHYIEEEVNMEWANL